MSAHALAPLLSALVSRLKADLALAGWTVTDRPVRPDQLPHIRVGPSDRTPWTTSTSLGAQAQVTLDLSSRTGSQSDVDAATSAITTLVDAGPLPLSEGTVVLQRVTSARSFIDTALGLERATLSIVFLIDYGERPTPV
ncbi:MAG: DUF3168 domain-containing protein [Pseudomonadota bacterium]